MPKGLTEDRLKQIEEMADCAPLSEDNMASECLSLIEEVRRLGGEVKYWQGALHRTQRAWKKSCRVW